MVQGVGAEVYTDNGVIRVAGGPRGQGQVVGTYTGNLQLGQGTTTADLLAIPTDSNGGRQLGGATIMLNNAANTAFDINVNGGYNIVTAQADNASRVALGASGLPGTSNNPAAIINETDRAKAAAAAGLSSVPAYNPTATGGEKGSYQTLSIPFFAAAGTQKSTFGGYGSQDAYNQAIYGPAGAATALTNSFNFQFGVEALKAQQGANGSYSVNLYSSFRNKNTEDQLAMLAAQYKAQFPYADIKQINADELLISPSAPTKPSSSPTPSSGISLPVTITDAAGNVIVNKAQSFNPTLPISDKNAPTPGDIYGTYDVRTNKVTPGAAATPGSGVYNVVVGAASIKDNNSIRYALQIQGLPTAANGAQILTPPVVPTGISTKDFMANILPQAIAYGQAASKNLPAPSGPQDIQLYLPKDNRPMSPTQLAVANAYAAVDRAAANTPIISFLTERGKQISNTPSPFKGIPVIEGANQFVGGILQGPGQFPKIGAAIGGIGLAVATNDTQAISQGIENSKAAERSALSNPNFYIGVLAGATVSGLAQAQAAADAQALQPRITSSDLSAGDIGLGQKPSLAIANIRPPTNEELPGVINNLDLPNYDISNMRVVDIKVYQNGQVVNQGTFSFQQAPGGAFTTFRSFGAAAGQQTEAVGLLQQATDIKLWQDVVPGAQAQSIGPDTMSMILRSQMKAYEPVVFEATKNDILQGVAKTTGLPAATPQAPAYQFDLADYFVGRTASPGVKSIALIKDINVGSGPVSVYDVAQAAASNAGTSASRMIVYLDQTGNAPAFVPNLAPPGIGQSVDVVGGSGAVAQQEMMLQAQLNQQQLGAAVAQAAASLQAPPITRGAPIIIPAASGAQAAIMAELAQTKQEISLPFQQNQKTLSLPAPQQYQLPDLVQPIQRQVPDIEQMVGPLQRPASQVGDLQLPGIGQRPLQIQLPTSAQRPLQLPAEIQLPNQLLRPTQVELPDQLIKPVEITAPIQIQMPDLTLRTPELQIPGLQPPIVPTLLPPILPPLAPPFLFPNLPPGQAANDIVGRIGKAVKGRYVPSLVSQVLDIREKGNKHNQQTARAAELTGFAVRPILDNLKKKRGR